MLDSSPQFEGRRQAYLAALGIPLWTVRQEVESCCCPSSPTPMSHLKLLHLPQSASSGAHTFDELPVHRFLMNRR